MLCWAVPQPQLAGVLGASSEARRTSTAPLPLNSPLRSSNLMPSCLHPVLHLCLPLLPGVPCYHTMTHTMVQGEERLVLRKAGAAGSDKTEALEVVVRPAPPSMVAPQPGALQAYEVELPHRVAYVAPTRMLGGMLLEVGCCALSCPAQFVSRSEPSAFLLTVLCAVLLDELAAAAR